MASIVLIPQPLRGSEKIIGESSARHRKSRPTIIPGATIPTKFLGLDRGDGKQGKLAVGDSLRLSVDDLPYVKVHAFKGIGSSAKPLMFLLEPTSGKSFAPTPVDRLHCVLVANPKVGDVVADLLKIVSPRDRTFVVELADPADPEQPLRGLTSLEIAITAKSLKPSTRKERP